MDVDAGTVFQNLDGAFLGMYSAERDRWGIFADIVYMNLEADVTGSRGLVEGTLGNRQLTSMTAATWRMNDQWRVMGGVMYTGVDMSLETSGPITSRNRGRSVSWWDPYVGAKYSRDLNPSWSFLALATAGGFGVGSDVTWSANVAVAFRMTPRSSITFMYRYIDFDYEEGSGTERFRFDIAQYGPAFGWRHQF